MIRDTPLLSHHPVFRSSDIEETRAFLGRKEYHLDLPPRCASQLDACINTVYMPGMYLAYIHYGETPIELSPGLQRSDYVLQLPLRGRLEATLGNDTIVCSPDCGAIASPSRERCWFRAEPDNARIQFVLNQASLIDQLSALLGEPFDRSPDFAPAVELSSGHGRELARYLLMAAADLDRTDSMLLHPMAMRAFQQFITTCLLLSQPHSHSDALKRLERPIAPYTVKRAIDYIEANLSSPIGLGDIVAATGVPGRTLLQHFVDTRGMSPMRYVRNARMLKAREELMRLNTAESITQIAMRWGFSHLGRFAMAYRQHFGESPSETRRRSRN